MRKNGSNLALAGLLASVAITVTPNYAVAEVSEFIQEFIRSTPRYVSPAQRSQPEFAKPIKRRAGHSDTVRANALQPAPYVVLSQKKLKPAEEMDGLATAVHAFLNKPAGTVLRVRSSQRKPIIAFYKNNDFSPLWVGKEGMNDKARRLLALLSRADEEGLRAQDFLPGSLSDFNDSGDNTGKSPSDLARLDIELTVAALEYSHQASAGRVKPIRISELHSIKAMPVNPSKVLRKLKATPEPDSYLASLQPLMPQYRYLKKALAKYRQSTGAEKTVYVPGGGLIKAGNSDDRVELIAKRLAQLGFYDGNSQPDVDSRLYTPALVAAVKDMQEQSGLRRDGVIGRNTLAALNGQSPEDKVAKIILSMERLRWLPQDLKSKYIFVNQAFFETWMMDKGKEVYRSKVVVGKPKFQTAVFTDEMEKVVLNPSWYVPRSIIYEEMIPKLISNPYYLQDEGYEVTDASGRIVNSSSVDWGQYTRKTIPFGIRQPPGPGNALGRVKFRFPNKHAIYMHDTPARSLFKKSSRAFSHGCVRLDKPMEFARIILGAQGWSPKRIQEAIDTGKNQTIELDKKIPVYLGYYTAWADADGNVKTRDDVYGRDRVLKQAFEQNIEARTSRKYASR